MNYYEVLNISQEATDEDIKRAYHKLARINHPDKNGKKEDFQKIQEAYQVLSDEEHRRNYNIWLRTNGDHNDMPNLDNFPVWVKFYPILVDLLSNYPMDDEITIGSLVGYLKTKIFDIETGKIILRFITELITNNNEEVENYEEIILDCTIDEIYKTKYKMYHSGENTYKVNILEDNYIIDKYKFKRNILDHKYLKVDKYNLKRKINVSLSEWVLGGEWEIKHPYCKHLRIRQKGYITGECIELSGWGLPKGDRTEWEEAPSDDYGDLLVEFNLKFDKEKLKLDYPSINIISESDDDTKYIDLDSDSE